MEGRTLSLAFLFLTLAYVQIAIAQNLASAQREKALEAKCKLNGKDKAWGNFQAGRTKFDECMKKFYVSDAAFRKDMEELKPNGNHALIVTKYCKKYQELNVCLSDGFFATGNCLDKYDQEALDYTRKLFDASAKFSCQNNGKEFISFLGAGRDCVHEKLPALFFCGYDMLNKYATPIGLLPEDGYSLIKMGQLKCGDVDAFKKCAVQELEKCQNKTAANFIKSLFNEHEKVPCNDKTKNRN